MAATGLDAFSAHLAFQTKLQNVPSAVFAVVFQLILILQKRTYFKASLAVSTQDFGSSRIG